MTHLVQILSKDELAKFEGTVDFAVNGKSYKAFYFGEDFEPNQYFEVEFDHLGISLDWNEIFKGYQGKKLKLERTEDSTWSYNGYGKIIAINSISADFGGIQLELGEWSNDAELIGEFTYWKIELLDIISIKK